MRLKRLDLTRYGKFTDFALNFGEQVVGQPDLHVVYGPNEAGKSTSLSAFLDLLFGIETQSAYNFIHPYPSMQIGGALEMGGATHELVRIKAKQNSLLGLNGQPADEGILAGALSGISRDAYQTMFSLDDETLEAGGKSILASKGELGQLLFAASTGLADLSQALTSLREQAEAFHKPGARTRELSEIKKQLADLKERKDAIDILASAYANLVLERDNAGLAYDEAMRQRTEAKARMDEVQRLAEALPRLANAERVRAQLLDLNDLPEPPMEWAAELPGLMQDETRLSTQLGGIDAEIERLDAEIEAVQVDEAALAMASRLKGLEQARYITAEKDLPERHLSLRAFDTQIAGIVQRLGQAAHHAPTALVLPASMVGTLRALIESRSGIDAELQTTQREQARADDDFAEAQAKLDAVGEVEENPSLANLSTVLSQLRRDDHLARRNHAEKDRNTQRRLLTESLAGLAPFDADELASLVVPEPAQIALWRAGVVDVGKRLERLDDELERLLTAQAVAEAELAVLRSAAGALGDDEANAKRQAREAAWSVHKAQLEAETAEAFEQVLRADDSMTEARLRQSTDVAKLRQAAQTVASNDALIQRARDLRDSARGQQQALRSEIEQAIAVFLPLPKTVAAETALVQLESWLARRGGAMDARLGLEQAEEDFEEAKSHSTSVVARLSSALEATGLEVDMPTSFDGLLSLAEQVLAAETRRQGRARGVLDQFELCAADLRRRNREFEAAQAMAEDWQSRWTETLGQSWLGMQSPLPDLGAVRAILAEIADLAPALERRDQLADRIAKMKHDEEQFVAGLAACLAELGEALDADRVMVQANSLSERVERARVQHEALAGKRVDRRNAEHRRQQIGEAIATHEARRAEMLAFFSVETLNAVSERLEMVRRKNVLLTRLDEVDGELLAGLRLTDIAAARAALAGVDEAALTGEVSELEARFKDLDQRTQQLYAARSKAADAVDAVGGDDAVARLNEQRQTLLLDLEEKALAHLRLRIGALAAEQALRVYRDRHRSSMMEHASDAFSTISRGAYSGLAARPEKDMEVLIGLASGGGSKLAVEMSKGTRFQLYLALRVAGYYEFARSRQPVPFFADDIMETFDDFRAEEAFRLFAGMAQVGQVIYLTHHRHLCDIARSVCPTVKIHELAAMA